VAGTDHIGDQMIEVMGKFGFHLRFETVAMGDGAHPGARPRKNPGKK
jgi:hypothetical protein